MDFQRRLWRITGWVGILTGVLVVMSLMGDLALGFNQAYFEAAQQGSAGELIAVTRHSDYALVTGSGLLIMLLRLLLGVLFFILLRTALIAAEQFLAASTFQIAASGAVAAALLAVFGYFFSLLYATDADRYLFVITIKLGNALYSWMLQLALGAILWASYNSKRIPRPLVYSALSILVGAFLYSLFATHPHLTQFFSALITYLAALLLAMYMLVASYRPIA